MSRVILYGFANFYLMHYSSPINDSMHKFNAPTHLETGVGKYIYNMRSMNINVKLLFADEEMT